CRSAPWPASRRIPERATSAGVRRAAHPRGCTHMAPFYEELCQGGGSGRPFEWAPALVGVNVVRPVGRSTLTPPARRRGMAPVPGLAGFLAGGGGGSVEGAGPGNGWSEEPMSGVRSVALDFRVVPECPPGPA